MSTEASMSPILRMRHEYWSSKVVSNTESVLGKMPMDDRAHINPPTQEVGGRYGLVGENCESVSAEESFTAPVDRTGARYGLVGRCLSVLTLWREL